MQGGEGSTWGPRYDPFVDKHELARESGIREVSEFFSHFGGEDVVVRPATPEREPFVIEVLITDTETTFPPSAPVHEGDIVDREDPRGGVIESVITEYTFRRDPFGNGNDHWAATLTEKGHAARQFGQQNIVVNGDSNQFSFGNANVLNQTNTYGVAGEELVEALDKLESTMPRDEMTADQVAEIAEVLGEARSEAANGADDKTMKRALRALRGAVAELLDSVKEGAKDKVRLWGANVTALVVQYLAGGAAS